MQELRDFKQFVDDVVKHDRTIDFLMYANSGPGFRAYCFLPLTFHFSVATFKCPARFGHDTHIITISLNTVLTMGWSSHCVAYGNSSLQQPSSTGQA
jgi:hypothetical protein